MTKKQLQQQLKKYREMSQEAEFLTRQLQTGQVQAEQRVRELQDLNVERMKRESEAGVRREQQVLDLEREHSATIQFLNSKLATQNWHTVARCAMDLAEIEAELLWAKRK